MLRAPYLETAGKSKQKTHQFDSATFVHMWTQAPEVVFTSAPQLLISRRQDPVLNHGWEEIMRLQAVGWSKQSPSTTIMFAPSVRMRYLGEGAGQALRFDIWFQVAESFLTRQSKAAAQASKSKSQIKACAPETTASSPRAPAASRSATRECSEQRPRLLGEGVECDLCQIVQGAAAAVLANPCAYYKCTFENGGQGAGPGGAEGTLAARNEKHNSLSSNLRKLVNLHERQLCYIELVLRFKEPPSQVK